MQDLPRLHLEPEHDALAAGVVLPMPGGQAHYLGSVMRRQAGDPVRLFNSRDGEWQARIESLRRERGSFRIETRLRPPAPEPGPTLLFAPLKRDATDLLVRMATELGVAALQPVATERTNTTRINPDRWRTIAVEAAEQCERLSVPTIATQLRLPELLDGWDPGRPLLAAIERSGTQTPTIGRWRDSARIGDDRPPALLVGPEGGFSATEQALLRGRPWVVTVSLGHRILRAETAALAGLACLL